MKLRGFVAVVALSAGGALGTSAAVSLLAHSAPPPQQTFRPAVPIPGQTPGRGRANQPPPPPLVTTGLIVGRVVDANGGAPIAGAVVVLSGGPTRSAPVMPSGSSLPPLPTPRILTDSEGRFAFRSLTRGNYSIGATKSGYSAGAYGRSRPDGPTRPLQLDDGERMRDVTIRMFKYASITGMVSDEAGEPVVGATVRVDRRALLSGRRVLVQANSAVQTDDRGVYRISNLSPGEYVVYVPIQSTSSPAAQPATPDARQNLSATTRNLIGLTTLNAGGRQLSPDGRFFWQAGSNAPLIPDGTGKWRGYATTYYPGATTVGGAQPVVVTSGEDRMGIDLAMRYVPTSSVSGTVAGPTGPAAHYALRLIPTDSGEWSVDPQVSVALTDASGSFTFLAVPTGQYVIQTVRIPRQPQVLDQGPQFSVTTGELLLSMSQQSQQPEPLLWAMTTVSVGESDVTGVSLTLQEGLTISGRLDFAGSRPKPDGQRLAQIPLSLEAASGRDVNYANGPPSRVQPDGRFTISPRLPGKYFLRVGGSPSGFIVHSITVNGVDATEVPIDLASNISNVVITFTDLIASISGTVRGTPAGSDPPAIVLFPSDRTAWSDFGVNPLRMRMTRTTSSGAFSFGSLVAGDYCVVAIRDEFSSEWMDPAYLEVLSRAAQRFALGAGEKRVLDLTVSDVKPPGIGRLATRAAGPSRLSPSDPAPEAIAKVHGPFVADDSAPQQPRDGRAGEPVGTGAISGVVTVTDGSTHPARLARVSVTGGALAGERLALTDDEGRFTVAWLPAGDYQVMVTKPAYLTMPYGAKRPGIGSGTPVHVDAGQMVTGIDVTLPRGAVIAGQVLDALRQPAANVRMQLQAYTRRDGMRLLSGAASAGTSTTDDRGMYRLYGIRPGSYVISVVPPTVASNTEIRQLSDADMRAAIAEAGRSASIGAPPIASDQPRTIAPAPAGDIPAPQVGGRPVGYSPVFYPGTIREQDAVEIPLTAGQELTGVNIQLLLVPAVKLEGRVISPTGQYNNVQVLLQKFTGTSSSSTSMRQLNGVFQAAGVPAGHYFLTGFMEVPRPRAPAAAGAPASPREPATVYWGQLELDLNGEDQLNLVLPLALPPTISGRVVFDGATRPDMKNVQVRVEPTGFPVPSPIAPAVSPDANGAFVISSVIPGKYRLSATATMPGAAGTGVNWSTVSSTIDRQDALVTPFDVRADRPMSGAVVTLTDQPAELSGKLIDGNGRPVPGMTVAMFPVDRTSWATNMSRLNRTIRPGPDAAFRFTSVLPGEYYLVVLTELDNNDWTDPAFKEQLIPSAIKVSVAKGEKKVQDIKMVRTP